MSTNTRLTITMDNNLRTRLKQRADELGFDSSQALLIYVSKAIVEGRQDQAVGKLKTYSTSKEAL